MASKRVVITGASSGIGRSAALHLAKSGHALVLVSRRLDVLLELSKECAERGARAISVASLDLAKTDQSLQLQDAVRNLEVGEIVLINAAGHAQFGSFHETPLADHLSQIQVNTSGTIAATHALVPLMLDSGSGQIINVLSVAVNHAFPGAAAYSASKAAINAFGRSLSVEYRGQGIRVTSLYPGATDTALWDVQSGHPPRDKMLTARAVGRAIRDLVNLPPDRVVDEMTITPPLGIL